MACPAPSQTGLANEMSSEVVGWGFQESSLRGGRELDGPSSIHVLHGTQKSPCPSTPAFSFAPIQLYPIFLKPQASPPSSGDSKNLSAVSTQMM